MPDPSHFRVVQQALLSLQVHEYVACNHCQGKLSHSSKHSQFFYHTSATALRNEMAEDVMQGLAYKPDSLGSYLARVERQTRKTCDVSEGTPFEDCISKLFFSLAAPTSFLPPA